MLGEFFRAKRPCAGLGGDAAHFRLVAVGVLRHAKPFCGVSPACRSLAWRNSPRLLAARPRLEGRGHQTADPLGEIVENGLLVARWTAFWAKQCRTCASFAREPLNIRVSPLMRTSTPRHAPGRRFPRPYHRVNVRVIEPTCASKGPSHHLLGPGAQQVARTRISGQRAE